MDYPIHITLFFTFGASLKTWAETGLLEREIRLYQELMRRYRLQVCFVTYGDASDRNWEAKLKGIKLFPVYERLHKPHSKLLKFFQSFMIPCILYKEMRHTNLIKTNQIWGGWVAVLSKWLFRKPMLARCGYELYKTTILQKRSRIYIWISKFVTWITYKHANHIFVSSKNDKHFVEKTFGIANNKITVFPNWIDTRLFAPSQKSYNKLNRVIFVGRFSPEKNIPLLFQALENTGIGIDLVGDGEIKAELIDLAKKSNVDANFLDRFPNSKMPNIYQKYSVYILCSKYEGNPKTLLEAMACGLAVIGTDILGISEIISNGQNGLLVPEDAVELRTAIQNLFSDAALCHTLGANAREYIIKNNSLEHAVPEEYAVYQQLIN